MTNENPQIEDAEIVSQPEISEETKALQETLDDLITMFKQKENRNLVISMLHGLNEDEFNNYLSVYNDVEAFKKVVSNMVLISTHAELVKFYETTNQIMPDFLKMEYLVDTKRDDNVAINGLKEYGVSTVESVVHPNGGRLPFKQYTMKFNLGSFHTDVTGEFNTKEFDLYVVSAMAIILLNHFPREYQLGNRAFRVVAAAHAIGTYEELVKGREEVIKLMEEAQSVSEDQPETEDQPQEETKH